MALLAERTLEKLPCSLQVCLHTCSSLIFSLVTLSNAFTHPCVSIRKDLDAVCMTTEQSLGLEQGKMSQAWNSLSGGERQRAAIGCALILATSRMGFSATSPSASGSPPSSVVLFDEPTAACDPQTTLMVERAIISSGVATMFITHDDRQARRLAHLRLVLTKKMDEEENEN